jgi:hypothetical protein
MLDLFQFQSFVLYAETIKPKKPIENSFFIAVDLQTQPSNDQQDSEGGCMC